MRAKRFFAAGARGAVLVLAVFSCLAVAAPAQAAPLWPSGYGPEVPAGPEIAGAAPFVKHWRDLPKELQSVLPKDKAPCKAPGVKACVEKSSQLAWLMDGKGNTVWGPTRISTGRPGYETPAAVTKIYIKKPYHWSTMHFAHMYWALFFNGDMATHIGDVNEMSHGCLRMTPEGAKKFYDYLKIGDTFQVIN